MDERHWWIAKRISQAFGKIDSSELEKFICEESNLEKINFFLCMNGSNKLFVCGSAGSDHDLLVVDDLLKLPRSIMQSVDQSVVLYFIRHDSMQEVSANQIHKEVFCGEIRNVSEILYNVYNDLLLAMFESNRNWTAGADESAKAQAVRNMEKYINAIREFSINNLSQKNMILKRVDADALNELKQQARVNPDSPVIKYCEDLALDWMITIENILSDICDERIIHQSVGPNSELERWQRKQRLLSQLTEQLKSKECKAVISALITCKSRVIKKWKTIDAGITDAQNECRDKVKFLEMLRRSLEQLYHDSTPLTCISTALPSLCTSMRTVESVSRYYARQGYLGLLFTKVTNQLVNICKEYLIEFAQISSASTELTFWPIIFKEINEYENNLEKLVDFDYFNLSTSVILLSDIFSKKTEISFISNRIMFKMNKSKTAEPNETLAKMADTFFGRLKACLLLQTKYKEVFRNLRDALGGSHALASFPSMSSSSELNTSLKEAQVSTRKPVTHRRNESMKPNGDTYSEATILPQYSDIPKYSNL